MGYSGQNIREGLLLVDSFPGYFCYTGIAMINQVFSAPSCRSSPKAHEFADLCIVPATRIQDWHPVLWVEWAGYAPCIMSAVLIGVPPNVQTIFEHVPNCMHV